MNTLETRYSVDEFSDGHIEQFITWKVENFVNRITQPSVKFQLQIF